MGRSKIVFRDAGLASELSGFDAAGLEGAIASPLTGGLVENFAVAELLKQQAWSTVGYSVSHFRDRDGHEVDIVLESRRGDIVGVEVKATTSVGRNHFKGLRFLQDKVPDRFRAGIVLHLGKECHRFGPGLWALPLASLWSRSRVG
ncbi:DUF4143 domain-containing protein [Corynebacterium heidelbergense]|uniref:DUF4143 domain-containing protein n=1 Tax=Corynebacterium heidelbergense TaxID=2055947 RepID=UPI001930F22E|nr:DUF4143 domain-containing protein [Corynebacterium heidelbergense]